MGADVLTDRALNRATLARQLLLERSDVDPVAAVEQLVGLQAQNPLDPYLSLWSRIEGFDPTSIAVAVEDRRLVRIVVMRGTIHLVTATDAARIRPVVQPVMDAEIARHPEYGPPLRGVDLAPALAHAAAAMAERPRTSAELRASLAEHVPEVDAAAATYAARCHLPLVQIPPRGMWGRSGAVRLTTLGTWVGGVDGAASPVTLDDLVLRYLAAFGPATVADATAWSRLTSLRTVVERLRPRLRTFLDEHGRELFDVPDGLRPDPDVPAQVRVLPEYDNALLSFAAAGGGRSRFGSDEDRRFRGATGPPKGTVLVDGRVRAIWHPEPGPKDRPPTLVVEHLPLEGGQSQEVEAEARRAGRYWLGGGDDVDVRLVAIAA